MKALPLLFLLLFAGDSWASSCLTKLADEARLAFENKLPENFKDRNGKKLNEHSYMKFNYKSVETKTSLNEKIEWECFEHPNFPKLGRICRTKSAWVDVNGMSCKGMALTSALKNESDDSYFYGYQEAAEEAGRISEKLSKNLNEFCEFKLPAVFEEREKLAKTKTVTVTNEKGELEEITMNTPEAEMSYEKKALYCFREMLGHGPLIPKVSPWSFYKQNLGTGGKIILENFNKLFPNSPVIKFWSSTVGPMGKHYLFKTTGDIKEVQSENQNYGLVLFE